MSPGSLSKFERTMEDFFDQLKVGDELQTRVSLHSRWAVVTVTEIDGEHITMEYPNGMYVESFRDEINEQNFFKPMEAEASE